MMGAAEFLLDLLKILGEIVGQNFDPIFNEVREGDIRHSRPDINHAQAVLDYQSKYDLYKGLSLLVDSTKKKEVVS